MDMSLLTNDISILNDFLDEFNITLSDSQLNKFNTYYELLVSWNEKMNLTAITDFKDVVIKHFVDSLSICKCDNNSLVKSACFDGKEISVIDIGTGAGFPAIPLKIAFPNLNITMLDSLNKRITFLNEVISTLSLKGIEAIHGRAEDYASPSKLREKFDLCVSRAVANLSTLSEYCLPYVKQGGYFISYKSEVLKEEIDPAAKAIKILGGEVENICEFNLPKTDFYRCLCNIKKVNITPKKYPRKAGLPSKEPIGKIMSC